MVMISFYGSIDTMFLGRYVSANAMASINIVIPYTNVMWGIAVMLAAGACAYAGIAIGQQKKEEANQIFTQMLVVLLLVSASVMALSLVGIHQILQGLGVSELLYHDAYLYLIMLILSAPILMVKLYFEYFLRLVHRSHLAMQTSIGGLVLNILLDALFVVVFDMGVLGAALGTLLSVAMTTMVSFWYILKKDTPLFFHAFHWDVLLIGKVMFNGSSEFFVEISTAIITFLFNTILMQLVGERGVATMAILTTIYYFVLGFYVGIATGITPLISHSYGASHFKTMQKVLRYGMLTMVFTSIAFWCVLTFGKPWLVSFFTQDAQLTQSSIDALRVFQIGLVLIGYNVLVSTIYTAIGNGKVSLLLAVLRSFVFILFALWFFPARFGEVGVYLAIPFAEGCSLLFASYYLWRFTTWMHKQKKR